ncbi:MAG: hypothetical protein WCP28_15820 [Actinomycetes bacterium]
MFDLPPPESGPHAAQDRAPGCCCGSSAGQAVGAGSGSEVPAGTVGAGGFGPIGLGECGRSGEHCDGTGHDNPPVGGISTGGASTDGIPADEVGFELLRGELFLVVGHMF